MDTATHDAGKIHPDAPILAVDITPARQMLAVGYGNDNGLLVFRDLETVLTNRVLPLHVGSSELRFSPDGQLLALGGARPEMVNIVETSTGNLRQALPHPRRTADEVVLGPPVIAATSKGSQWRSAAIDAGDNVLVGTQAGQPARVWRGGTALELARSANADTVAVSADGRWIAAHLGGESGDWVWDATTGRRVRELRGTFAMQAVFSPDSRRVATGTAEEYCLWDVLGGEPVQRLPRMEGIRSSGPLAFSRDGRLLAIVRTLSLVQLVDPASGREVASLEHPDPRTIRGLAFNPAGTLWAAIANESVLQLWDLRRLRDELAGLKLDWEQPPLPRLRDPDASSASPRRVRILPPPTK